MSEVTINDEQYRMLKKNIIHHLTNEFGIFNKEEGWARYNGTDLEMVMDRVTFALSKSKGPKDGI